MKFSDFIVYTVSISLVCVLAVMNAKAQTVNVNIYKDINSANVEELVEIEGIGYKRAYAIKNNIPYESCEELEAQEDIGKKTIDKLKKSNYRIMDVK